MLKHYWLPRLSLFSFLRCFLVASSRLAVFSEGMGSRSDDAEPKYMMCVVNGCICVCTPPSLIQGVALEPKLGHHLQDNGGLRSALLPCRSLIVCLRARQARGISRELHVRIDAYGDATRRVRLGLPSSNCLHNVLTQDFTACHCLLISHPWQMPRTPDPVTHPHQYKLFFAVFDSTNVFLPLTRHYH